MKDIIISDIHFGEKNNNPVHNKDLLKFFKFLIDNEDGSNRLIITGDWHHFRDKIDVSTLSYSLEGMEILSNHFDSVRILVGNHDMYYRDNRDVHSLSIFKKFSNVEVIDSPIIDKKVMYSPWFLDVKEYGEIIDITSKKKIELLYCHAEFSNFRLNDNYIMEHGMTHTPLKHIEKVVTGHYHMRQEKDNVVYVGTPFPFNFNDANDYKRGYMILDPNTLRHEWVDYNVIKILSMNYDQFISQSFTDSNQNTSIRIILNEGLENDELEQLNEKLSSLSFRDYKIVFNFNRFEKIEVSSDTDIKVDSIEKSIVSHLKKIEDKRIDSKLLVNIFNKIVEK